MPSIAENQSEWGEEYAWHHEGDEWSQAWGGVETHWHLTLLPRLRPFLPAQTIVEIAPGHGRWSQFLIQASKEYVGIDLAESCIDACRSRFADASNASFYVNDGRSLDMIQDGSIDLAFSFDSLVHVEAEIIAAYLSELYKKLSDDGIVFFHHSNIGEFRTALGISRATHYLALRYPRWQPTLRRHELLDWQHWRAESMTAARFVELCRSSGLTCVGQEIVNWGGRRVIDCFSLATRPGSRWDRPNVTVVNPNLMAEAASASCVARVFTSLRSSDRQLSEP